MDTSRGKRMLLVGGVVFIILTVSVLTYYFLSSSRAAKSVLAGAGVTLPPSSFVSLPVLNDTEAAKSTLAGERTEFPVTGPATTNGSSTGQTSETANTVFTPIYYSRCQIPTFDFSKAAVGLVNQSIIDAIGTWWRMVKPTIGSDQFWLRIEIPVDVLDAILLELQKAVRESRQNIVVFKQIITLFKDEFKKNFNGSGFIFFKFLQRDAIDFTTFISHKYGPNDVANYTIEDTILAVGPATSYEYGKDLSCLS